jgi:hypothetical protein
MIEVDGHAATVASTTLGPPPLERLVTAPHLPSGASQPAVPVGIAPLLVDVGTVAGHRIVLLSLEVWEGWADLRFARIDVGAQRPLPRRVPPATAWTVRSDGEDLEVVDAVGRGDRAFSNGEVRLRPPPADGSRLSVTVEVVPGLPGLHADIALPALTT